MLNQNILITGASGNLGRATITHLIKLTSAEKVTALVRDPDKVKDLKDKGIK
jgi:NAD(P)H dehydrogenase (quinone)